MANILADTVLHLDFSFYKKTKISWLVTLHFVLQRNTQSPHEKVILLEYDSIWYDCSKISHAFVLHFTPSNSFKTMFLSGWKWVLKLCIFSFCKLWKNKQTNKQANKFFGKNYVFKENFIVNTFQFHCKTRQWQIMIDPFIWYQNMQFISSSYYNSRDVAADVYMFLNHSRTPAPILTKIAPFIALDPPIVMGGRGQGHPRSKVTWGKILKFAGDFNQFAGEFNWGHQSSRSPPYLGNPSTDLDQTCTRCSPRPPIVIGGGQGQGHPRSKVMWGSNLKIWRKS